MTFIVTLELSPIVRGISTLFKFYRCTSLLSNTSDAHFIVGTSWHAKKGNNQNSRAVECRSLLLLACVIKMSDKRANHWVNCWTVSLAAYDSMRGIYLFTFVWLDLIVCDDRTYTQEPHGIHKQMENFVCMVYFEFISSVAVVQMFSSIQAIGRYTYTAPAFILFPMKYCPIANIIIEWPRLASQHTYQIRRTHIWTHTHTHNHKQEHFSAILYLFSSEICFVLRNYFYCCIYCSVDWVHISNTLYHCILPY